MDAKEKLNIQTEIKARKIVVRRLATILTSLSKKVDVIKDDREKRKKQLGEYESERDLQDAYGWGFITEDEYDKLREAMRAGTAAIDDEVTKEEIAFDIVAKWKALMLSDISSLEFELLPEEEQNRIREQNYELMKRREERRAARNERNRG